MKIAVFLSCLMVLLTSVKLQGHWLHRINPLRLFSYKNEKKTLDLKNISVGIEVLIKF
jgi:hypothetical protein